MSLECKLFFMNHKCNEKIFYNYHVTGVETLMKRNI